MKGQKFIEDAMFIDKRNNKITKEPEIDTYKLCKICYSEELETVFTPCFHAIACKKCSVKLEAKILCPICVTPINSIETIYFS